MFPTRTPKFSPVQIRVDAEGCDSSYDVITRIGYALSNYAIIKKFGRDVTNETVQYSDFGLMMSA